MSFIETDKRHPIMWRKNDTSNQKSQCSTAVRTVVRATQQVNGKWPFSGCQNSVTPEPID